MQLIKDLQHRLNNHRPFTPPLEGIQHQYGINTNLLNEIVSFWKQKYNWQERQESIFNKYPQFITSIQGLHIHYIHVKPKAAANQKILPILLLHGWPSSVWEFTKLISLLTASREDQDFVLEVIASSLPGYGFSEASPIPGLGAAEISVVLKNLMKRLGHEKFYVQGGDFGGVTLQYLATLFPENVLGFHNQICFVTTPLGSLKLLFGALYPTLFTKNEHVDRVYPLGERMISDLLKETGHLHIQSTKPDTIGRYIS